MQMLGLRRPLERTPLFLSVFCTRKTRNARRKQRAFERSSNSDPVALADLAQVPGALLLVPMLVRGVFRHGRRGVRPAQLGP